MAGSRGSPMAPRTGSPGGEFQVLGDRLHRSPSDSQPRIRNSKTRYPVQILTRLSASEVSAGTDLPGVFQFSWVVAFQHAPGAPSPRRAGAPPRRTNGPWVSWVSPGLSADDAGSDRRASRMAAGCASWAMGTRKASRTGQAQLVAEGHRLGRRRAHQSRSRPRLGPGGLDAIRIRRSKHAIHYLERNDRRFSSR